MEKLYVVQRTGFGVAGHIERMGVDRIVVDQLRKRNDLVNHASQFDCGYEGSGPAQLALAIVADACGDADALAHHQDFKRAVIARLGGPCSEPFSWKMSDTSVRKMIEDLKTLGYHKVVERFNRNRPYDGDHAGLEAFRRPRKK